MTSALGLRTALAVAALLVSSSLSNAETTSTATTWETVEWGEVGTAHLANAPFPDDSRTTGFVSKRGEFPLKDHYDDNTVVFAIPKGYKPGARTDLIFHFHGHTNEARKALAQFKLGEQLEASGRNVILIIPQGPKNAPDSSGGKLEKPGVFKAFAAECLKTLQHNKKIPDNSKLEHIILSGHSGGYRVLGMILEYGGVTPDVAELWLFDAAYGQWDELARPFASKNGTARLRSIFTDHLAKSNLEIMSRLTLGGAGFAVVRDDQVTSTGVPKETFDAIKFHSPGAALGKDELPYLLRNNRILFISTELSHSDVIMATRNFEVFAREAPALKPR
ncbi:MAG: hypothetical protein K1X53_02325 [Candidatus Sumerlaeaceae bacterium]|nr:hypothetical protein [Candidatus Sumerlaeaceae bacterium]